MLTSFVYLQQGNVKKSKKLMKIVNTDEENLHIFRITILNVTKKQGFAPSIENTVLEKTQGGSNLPFCILSQNVERELEEESRTRVRFLGLSNAKNGPGDQL